MKTGQSKLFRKLALNRRTGRSMSLCDGGTCPSTILPVKDYLKARTIPKAGHYDNCRRLHNEYDTVIQTSYISASAIIDLKLEPADVAEIRDAWRRVIEPIPLHPFIPDAWALLTKDFRVIDLKEILDTPIQCS